ncbi:MAG: iron-containing alcohol dehydrogenase [Deltaproteobacteria bacterium]|nr:iron-containing alcohol dehydrogenase [Deltaproteobacteria bacterium]
MAEAILEGNWNYPTSVRFGPGRIRELPQALAELGIAKPLLVTDPVVAGLNATAGILDVLRTARVPLRVFSDVKPNPVAKNVAAGVRAFRRGRHDGVVALGGGSALDAAKAVALMVGQSRPLFDFEDVGDNWTRIKPEGMAPVVAIPTTSGTGSEVGRSSVFVDERTRTKRIVFHPRMLPGKVILDPQLTLDMPPRLTGAVGMDALSHSLEAYCATGFHPLADGIAVEAMRLVRFGLARAFEHGGDLAARSAMMAASAMGATAFQKGLGAMHSVAHAVGGMFDTHHGTTIAVMMPYVLRFNRKAIDERLARAAGYLGLARASFAGFLDWVLGLRRKLGIPERLDELGVTAKAVPELVERAAVDPTAGTNPVPLTTEALRGLVERAMTGRMS